MIHASALLLIPLNKIELAYTHSATNNVRIPLLLRPPNKAILGGNGNEGQNRGVVPAVEY